MTDKAVPRGYGAAFVDFLVAWNAGLPAATCSYTKQTVKIPLDGEEDVKLEGDLYLPIIKNGEAATGTILVQCPYKRGFLSIVNARIFAARGYNALFVSVRGTNGSGGKLDPGRSDAADAPRVVSWMRRQPWYTGTFATLGQSYLGFTQWALMGSPQPFDDMVAAIVQTGPHDFGDLLWGTGSFWLAGVDWAYGLTKQEKTSALRNFWNLLWMNGDGAIDVKRSVPLLEAVEAHTGDKGAFMHEWLKRPDIENDPFYEPMKQGKALEVVKVPVLLLGGWHDVFLNDTVKQFQRLSERGCPVALTIVPGNHFEATRGLDVTKEAFYWFEKYMAKRTPKKDRPAPVRINVSGADKWRWLPSWPPATKPLEMFLDVHGSLSQTRPKHPDEVKFTFDPHDPTPSIGGSLLFGGGKVDDSAFSQRRDVLTFTTTALEQDVEVLGKPRIELYHSSDNPHVDLFIRLSEIDTKGVSRNITQVYKRLDPSRAKPGQAVKVELELSDCAHRFKKGTAIRVIVAGGSFPHYAYNLGSGEDQATGTTLRPATHMIHIAESEDSRIILPVSVN